jgi:arylsulfatase A-like enzyme
LLQLLVTVTFLNTTPNTTMNPARGTTPGTTGCATVNGALAAAVMAVALSACSRQAPPPNVVVILIDDLGWSDTGVYGSSFYETPNIDRLAAEGVRFTQFYTASPVCSPTRASLMTGKHPARLHITNWIGGEQDGKLLQAPYERQLPLDEVTFGEAFQEAGYVTGYIGKWHLGGAGFLPNKQGFEYMRAVNEAGQPGSYFAPYENESWPVTNVPDLDDDTPGTYLTDRLTTDAVSFIERNSNDAFLLVLSHYAVHTPLQAKPEDVSKYEEKRALPGDSEDDREEFLRDGDRSITKTRQDHPVYASMVESVDASVGRVLATLDRLGLRENTIVVLLSDNGGLSTLAPGRTSMPTSNWPLRAGKGWLYEGGIRVPLIVRLPGSASGGASGGTSGGASVSMTGLVVDHPVTSTDIYPTLLELSGLELRSEQHADGRSFGYLLQDRAAAVSAREYAVDATRADTLYWYFPHYHGSGNTPSGAVRVGSYKLIKWMEDGVVELYDLSSDMGETIDVANVLPDKAAELSDALVRWRQAVGAHSPTPNATFVARR